MSECVESYYGSGWGDVPYGSPEILESFGIVTAVSTYENAIEVEFTEPIYFSELHDSKDASVAENYTITTIDSSIGYDGNPPRSVRVIKVELLSPNKVLLWLDRTMTPYPAKYILTCSNIWTVDKTTAIDPCFGQYGFYGLFKQLQSNMQDLIVPSRDIASPQTKEAFADPLPYSFDSFLGVVNVDDTGDFAFDEGETSLKKRIIRRLITEKNKFQHLPGYGIGIESLSKKLIRASERAKVESDITIQLKRDPEIRNASVTFTPYPTKPSLVKLSLKIQTTIGLKFTVERSFELR